MTNSIFVIVEKQGGFFRKASVEVLCEGRRLADLKRATLIVVVLGNEVAESAKSLAKYGADQILVVEDSALTKYPTDVYCNVIETLIEAETPELILISATLWGKDLVAQLAVRLDVPLVMDCTGIDVTKTDSICERFLFGGKIMARVSLVGSPEIIATRPNVFVIEKNPREVTPKILNLDIAESKVHLVEFRLESVDKIDLTEADIIVAGGRGTNGDYKAIENLADVLGGAVGASRSSVDEGWRPHEDQIGQTGKVVSPNVYIACGISGSIQHIAGMSTSKYIIAINKDPDAPMFEKSDFGVVGDLHEAVPALIREIQKARQNQ